MFRLVMSAVALSTVALLAGCSVPTGDDSAVQSDDEALIKKSDNAFLMDVLARAGVPAVAPQNHIVGVGPSRSANITLKITGGGFTGLITQSGQAASEDGTVYGAIAANDFTKTGKVLVKGGASWLRPERHCCDIPSTDSLTAFVSCQTIVVPGSPVSCTITPAPVAKETDDKFMYDLLTDAGVDPEAGRPIPGAGTKFSAHVRVSSGGIAGVTLGSLAWGTKDHAAIKAAQLPRVEDVLSANGATWGAIGLIHPDQQTTLEADVTCSQSVTLHPVAHCTYEATNIRPF